MKTRLSVAVVFLALVMRSAFALGQQLTIVTEAGKQTQLTRADIEALPHVKATAGPAGSADVFEGVAVRTVLEKAGVAFGESLRGNRMASCLLVEAVDGYRAVIALPELDPAFSDKQIMLAFLRNGKPLDNKEGPYRIVIPDEKRMARWAKMVTTLKIVDVQ